MAFQRVGKKGGISGVWYRESEVCEGVKSVIRC